MDWFAKIILAAGVGKLFSGGPEAIIVLLLAFIGMLVWEIRRLRAEREKTDERLFKIVDDYQKGNTALTVAFEQLKMLLFEIRMKM